MLILGVFREAAVQLIMVKPSDSICYDKHLREHMTPQSQTSFALHFKISVVKSQESDIFHTLTPQPSEQFDVHAKNTIQ